MKAHIHRAPLEGINDVFDALRTGRVDGRMVLDLTKAEVGNPAELALMSA